MPGAGDYYLGAVLNQVHDDSNNFNNSAYVPLTVLESVDDLAITVDDGVPAVAPGALTTYVITVLNLGGLGITDAVVHVPLPAGVLGATWTCDAGEGTCSPSGSGAIFDVVSLPAGAYPLEYQMTCGVDPGAAGAVTLTATVTMPVGIDDVNPTNNSASDTNMIGGIVFFDGFESGDFGEWSLAVP